MADDPSLLDHAKAVIAKELSELDGPDDDIMPVFLWLGPHGTGLMPMVPMGDDNQKDQLAAAMTAALAVSRAIEAVFISTSWIVTADPNKPGDATRVMPSQHPDRKECIALMHSDVLDNNEIHEAVLTRHPDRLPDLGPWETMGGAGVKMGGRFGDAIKRGLSMAQQMPPEMAEMIEEGWAQGTQQEMIQRFLNVQAQFTGVAATGIAEVHTDEDGKQRVRLGFPAGPMSPAQMAARFDIPLRTIYEVLRSGVLVGRRVQGKWSIEADDAYEYAQGYQERKEEMEDE